MIDPDQPGNEDAAQPRTAGEIVRAMFAAMQAGDLEGMAQTIHEDVEVLEAESIPFYPGRFVGRDRFIGDVMGQMLTRYAVEIHGIEIIGGEAADRAVGRIDATFTSRTAGTSVRLPIVEVYEITDGQISQIDVFYKDSAAMQSAFGEGDRH